MEIWDAYFADGTPAGIDLVRSEPVPEGLYHLVCEILVRHTDGSFLLMQRDPNKDGYPGFWEATAGGSALKGETPEVCAKRELREETGLVSNAFTRVGRCLGRNAIHYNYLCVTDCDKTSVTLQEGETVAYKWLSAPEFIAFINSDEGIPGQKKRFRPFFEDIGFVR